MTDRCSEHDAEGEREGMCPQCRRMLGVLRPLFDASSVASATVVFGTAFDMMHDGGVARIQILVTNDAAFAEAALRSMRKRLGVEPLYSPDRSVVMIASPDA